MHVETWLWALGLTVVGCPALLVGAIGLPYLFGRSLSERAINGWIYAANVLGLCAMLGVLGLMLALDRRHIPLDLENWAVIPQQHFHFHLKFVFDRLSAPFVVLTFLLCGTVSAFASRYLHREPGYGRFSVCYAFFLLGMVLSSVAGTIEVLFFGWELVGLSSALLVAFFHERTAPVRNGLQVWSVYRLADAAFLIAAVLMHHMTGEGDFAAFTGAASWPDSAGGLASWQALWVGLLLLIAAAGKSALIPFSGWLPRAMEGPTPSSAIFYGALSVHLGAYLLLRVGPILESSYLLAFAVTALGLSTALYAATTARVQCDVKSALAFASLTQVGLIVAEIGVGLRYVPLVHILGHACLRTMQLLRAPTLLHDYRAIENAIGGKLRPGADLFTQRLRPDARRQLYRWALERGYFDGLLNEFVVVPFFKAFSWCDRAERRWTDWIAGESSRESDAVDANYEVVEELRL